jgi:hypothetical protein
MLADLQRRRLKLRITHDEQKHFGSLVKAAQKPNFQILQVGSYSFDFKCGFWKVIKRRKWGKPNKIQFLDTQWTLHTLFLGVPWRWSNQSILLYSKCQFLIKRWEFVLRLLRLPQEIRVMSRVHIMSVCHMQWRSRDSAVGIATSWPSRSSSG